MNLTRYRFLFLVVTLASQLGLSETLGLIEVGKDASEIRNQFVIFRERQAKNKNSEKDKDVVVFSICHNPERTFSRRCAENRLKTSLDTNAYLAALTPVFNLENYERLRQRLADQEESTRRYRTQAGQAPESERTQIESDLEKGLQQISTTQTDLQGIRASNVGYPAYHRILTALNAGEEDDATISIFSSSNQALFSGAIHPFVSWFRENICTCNPMFEGTKENVCLLRKNGNVLAWMRSENGCATRNACLRGTWFAGARPSTTPARLNFDDLLNSQCSGYLNIGSTFLPSVGREPQNGTAIPQFNQDGSPRMRNNLATILSQVDKHSISPRTSGATLNLLIPNEAILWVDGHRYPHRGDRRGIVTPDLSTDEAHEYALVVNIPNSDQPWWYFYIVFQRGYSYTFDLISATRPARGSRSLPR